MNHPKIMRVTKEQWRLNIDTWDQSKNFWIFFFSNKNIVGVRVQEKDAITTDREQEHLFLDHTTKHPQLVVKMEQLWFGSYKLYLL